MLKLILVRHSSPEIVPAVPADQWLLSEAGRLRCKPLAEKLKAHQPDLIVTSTETKAVETAQIVAQLLHKPVETAEGLHEHDRSNVRWLERDQFEAAVVALLEKPETLVLGNETGDQAHHRFAEAITNVLGQHPGGNVAVVTHGTVLALYISRATGLEPFALWKRLGMPSLVVLSLPVLELLTVVESV